MLLRYLLEVPIGSDEGVPTLRPLAEFSLAMSRAMDNQAAKITALEGYIQHLHSLVGLAPDSNLAELADRIKLLRDKPNSMEQALRRRGQEVRTLNEELSVLKAKLNDADRCREESLARGREIRRAMGLPHTLPYERFLDELKRVAMEHARYILGQDDYVEAR